MKKVFIIITPFNVSQKMCVIATSISEAEEIFRIEYGTTIKILSIELFSEYVLFKKENSICQI